MDSTAISRYTRALFQLAEKQNILGQAEKDLSKVCELVRQHPEISHLVLNSTIAQAEKEDFIEKVFPAQTSKLVVEFLKVLVKKKRFSELLWIQKEFHRLYEKKQGIQEVKAITAVPMSGANQEKLKAVLKRKLAREIRLVTETDPDVLGGFILQFDGMEIDAAYKTRLLEMKQILMKSS